MSKSKYETNVEPRLREVEAWCRDGVPERDMAHNLHVAYSTFREYKNKYPALSAMLTRTKSYVDDVIVTGAYLKRIDGYTKTLKTTRYKFEPLPEGGFKKIPIDSSETEVHYPADARAAEFWLTHRQPEKWSSTEVVTETEETTVIEIPAITDLIEPVDTEEVEHDESSVDTTT